MTEDGNHPNDLFARIPIEEPIKGKVKKRVSHRRFDTYWEIKLEQLVNLYRWETKSTHNLPNRKLTFAYARRWLQLPQKTPVSWEETVKGRLNGKLKIIARTSKAYLCTK